MAKRSISWMVLVAKKLDVAEEWVREIINLKWIKEAKIGRWYVHPKDLKEFIKSRTNKDC